MKLKTIANIVSNHLSTLGNSACEPLSNMIKYFDAEQSGDGDYYKVYYWLCFNFLRGTFLRLFDNASILSVHVDIDADIEYINGDTDDQLCCAEDWCVRFLVDGKAYALTFVVGDVPNPDNDPHPFGIWYAARKKYPEAVILELLGVNLYPLLESKGITIGKDYCFYLREME